MSRARADNKLITLGSLRPRARRAVLKFVDLERDRAYGVQLHMSTSGVRPRLMGALWIHGETFKLLQLRLRELAAGRREAVVMAESTHDMSVRLVGGGGPLRVVMSRPARGEAPAREVTIDLEEGQLDGLLAFLADIERRL